MSGRGSFSAASNRLWNRCIDPLSPAIARFVGFTYFRAWRYDEAAREVEKAAEIGPRLPIVNWLLGRIYTQRRQFDRALKALSSVAMESHGGAMYVAMLTAALESGRGKLTSWAESR